MRKVIILKGPPGSGKSTFVSNMGWSAYALEMDQLRLLRSPPELSTSGRLHIPQDKNNKVFEEWVSLIDKRMDRGEFLVLDAMFADEPTNILQMAQKYLYDVLCVDFSKVPLEQVLVQNDSRPEYKHVNETVIQSRWQKMQHQKPWTNNHIDWDEQGNYIQKVKDWVQVPMLYFDDYEKIIHIGDLQGCLTVLTGEGGVLEHGFNDNHLYIFVGDLLDRGIENGTLLRWFVDHAVDRDNVILIWGNHEEHLRRWAIGEPAVSEEFERRTLPQLLDAGITPSDAQRVCEKAVEMLIYQHQGHRVMVTHAGLPTVPTHPELISLRQYSKGTGYWSDPIDEQFERNAPSDWVQVHGHRNHGWQEIQARPRSFNLEDQVEFGGRLRWAILTNEGWDVNSNRNTVYQLEGSPKIERRRLQWNDKSMVLSNETAQLMRDHEGVKENQMKLQPHVVSFNFTKDVFFSAKWDDVVVKARGFFVNKENNEIVSRGYDKFFNIGERVETHIDHLCQTMTFPVIGYVKENGFLGNIGYDAKTGELFVATKSSSSGDFAQWFREILNDTMTNARQEGLARWLRDNEACMTFEVIDPVRDPHMVSYEKSKMILLDVFHRSETTERLSFEDLKGVADKFGLECKQRGIVFRDAQSFKGWYDKVNADLQWRYQGQDVEGFVLEDANGDMTKIKMAHYAFWKKMRGQKERMSREWDKVVAEGEKRNAWLDKQPQNRAPRFSEGDAHIEFVQKWKDAGQKIHPVAETFLHWCAQQQPSMWGQSIIALRDEFLKSGVEVDWAAPYAPYEQPAAVGQKVKM